MKKTVILTAAVLITLLCGMRALAAGTTSNWSAKLTFSMDSTPDISPITIGEGTTAAEAPKPPALPGFGNTGNIGDAVIDAFVVSSSAAQRAMNSIDAAVANEPGQVWPISVNVEKPGTTVKLNIDLTNFPPASSGYTLSVVNPASGVTKTFDNSDTTQNLFTAQTAGTNMVYVIVGKTSTFMISSSTGALGQVHAAANIGAVKDADIYVDGVKQGTTNASGTFSLPGLTPTTHTIRVVKQYYLGTQKTINVTASGGSVVLNDIYPGDFNGDGVINMTDIIAFRKCFGKPRDPQNPNNGYDAKCDFDNNGVVNMQDFMRIRAGYRKCESWLAGCTNF
jgi:Dockerin type I domain